MHEVSLGTTITDYISGKEIEDSTFEDLRQALARMLVEEKGYPKVNLLSRQTIDFESNGEQFSKTLDIVVQDDQGEPLMLLMFCSGEPGTYVRQTLAAARVWKERPFMFAAVTDTREALFFRVKDGQELGKNYHGIPNWHQLTELAASSGRWEASRDRISAEQRILCAYSGLAGPCCTDSCS